MSPTPSLTRLQAQHHIEGHAGTFPLEVKPPVFEYIAAEEKEASMQWYFKSLGHKKNHI